MKYRHSKVDGGGDIQGGSMVIALSLLQESRLNIVGFEVLTAGV
jgi:hypothetical protein